MAAVRPGTTGNLIDTVMAYEFIFAECDRNGALDTRGAASAHPAVVP